MTKEQKIVFYDAILDLQKKYASKIDIQTSFLVKLQLEAVTGRPLDGVIIRPNGDVRLDCIAPFVLGNVLKDSFMTIWRRTPSDIWKSAPVRKFIDSLDDYGFSSMRNNYLDKDVYLG